MSTRNKPFSVEEIRHIVANVVLALKFVHSRKVIHGDLKSLNLLLTAAGRVKLCDFGKSRKKTDEGNDVIENRATPFWMAPEMFLEGEEYGFGVDIWALGISMLEMKNRNPPFFELNKGLLDGTISNLPTLSLQEQRRMLGIPAPPQDLVEKSKGRNNNWRGFFDDEFSSYRRPSARRKSTEGSRENYAGFDPLLKDNSRVRLSFDDVSSSDSDVSLAERKTRASMRSAGLTKHLFGRNAKPVRKSKKKTMKKSRRGRKTSGGLKHTDIQDDSDGESFLLQTVKVKNTLLKSNLRKSRKNRKTGVEPINQDTDSESLGLPPRKGTYRRAADETSSKGNSSLHFNKRKLKVGKREKGPISIVVKGPKGMRKKKKPKERKKRSLVRELFANGKSSVLKRKKQVPAEEQLEIQAKIAEAKKKREVWDRKHSYTELKKQKDEVIFYEFIAWCLHTDYRKRPTAIELTEHPFVHDQILSLMKSEKSECGIDKHSDFLITSSYSTSEDLMEPMDDEMESDDDEYLSAAQLEREKFEKLEQVDIEKEVCSCSESQKYIRDHICKDLSKLLSPPTWRRKL